VIDSYIEGAFSVFMALLATALCITMAGFVFVLIYALYKGATDATWR
jgi:hypothetical protein